MKILLCTNAFENITNGPAKFANLVLQINERYPQHEIRILTEDITKGRLATLNKVYKVDLNFHRYLRLFGQVLRMFIYYNRAREIQKEYPYDVIVYINAFNGLWASMVSDIPTIGMINDDNNLKADLTTIRREKQWLKKYVFKQLEKKSTYYHKAIISNSNYLTQQLIEAYSLLPSKVYRLYKAIDLTDTTYISLRTFAQPIQLLFVKADYMRGGLEILAKALNSIQSIYFNITIVGPHTSFAAHIHSFFKGSKNVTINFLGEQPQPVVYQLLTKLDIFCVPSIQEALGVANIEALAFGIPVVSTYTGGVPEVLDYGNNGWLAEPNDPYALAKAIQSCIENPAQRLQKSENGRRYIQKFSVGLMLKEFIRILEGCK